MCMETERTVAVSCKGVKKTFFNEDTDTSKEVVKSFDLTVQENEFVVLFGPGECGKTTILNMIAGLEKPSDGTVMVNGKEITAPGPDVGVVYQTISLFPWMTVMGNVEYGPKMRGVPKKERQERAQRYIDLVGLNGFEKHYPVKISGGMKQRVGIARAYCNEPYLLVMDEPFGALDAQTRYLMQAEVERIWKSEKKTVLFVTNNIEEALYLADRIIVLRNCPTEIKAEYKIDLPRPRNYTDPEFLRLRQEISSVLDMTL